jgi:hypothetical protein
VLIFLPDNNSAEPWFYPFLNGVVFVEITLPQASHIAQYCYLLSYGLAEFYAFANSG